MSDSPTPDGRPLPRWLARAILVALVAVTLTTFGFATKLLPWSCTVGLAGAAVSVEADGPWSSHVCDGFVGQVTNGGSWYLYQGGASPAGAVICQFSIQGVTETVRDEGLLEAYGSSICRGGPTYVGDPGPLDQILRSIGDSV